MKNVEEKFKLVTPTDKYKKQAIKYIKEHRKYKSAINGSGFLYNYVHNYGGWLELLEQERNIIPNKDKVPTETYFFVRANDDKIVGMINIRLALNEKIKNSYGSIGYGIRPKERMKGYNKINLYLGLLECKKRGMKMVILSCNKDNIASSKTMLALGANFDREVYNEATKEFIRFYRIDVDYAIAINKSKYSKYIEE